MRTREKGESEGTQPCVEAGSCGDEWPEINYSSSYSCPCPGASKPPANATSQTPQAILWVPSSHDPSPLRIILKFLLPPMGLVVPWPFPISWAAPLYLLPSLWPLLSVPQTSTPTPASESMFSLLHLPTNASADPHSGGSINIILGRNGEVPLLFVVDCWWFMQILRDAVLCQGINATFTGGVQLGVRSDLAQISPPSPPPSRYVSSHDWLLRRVGRALMHRSFAPLLQARTKLLV